MKHAGANRREVLLGGAMALVAGALPAARAGTMAGTECIGADAQSAVARAATGVLLHDPRVPAAEASRGLPWQPATCLALDADPVRMWRGPQAALLADPRTALAGTTTWPQFLIVRGLAEESGRRVRQQRFDATTAMVSWQIS